MFLIKYVFPKRENENHALLGAEIYIYPIRQSVFTLGVDIDVYFPLKAGKEKWIYNRK